MLNWMALLPSKVFCFLEFDPGAKILLALIILFRFICMILGCCYGPYLYLVLPLGGLYLAADALLLYTIFGSGLIKLQENEEEEIHQKSQNSVTCDFKTQKIWIFLWLVLNIIAIITLIIAEILPLVNVGWWSMTSPKNSPVLVTTFFLVLILLVLLIYGQIVVLTVYLLLKDAWVRGILGNSDDDDDMQAGLTHNGKRIEIQNDKSRFLA